MLKTNKQTFAMLALTMIVSTLAIALPVQANGLIIVPIDIKPQSCPNGYNPRSKGILPVAIGTVDASEWPGDSFDASLVDPDTVMLGTVQNPQASPVRWTYEDVDGDGDIDLLFFFKRQELTIGPTDTSLWLTGETWSGDPFLGTDGIKIVPK